MKSYIIRHKVPFALFLILILGAFFRLTYFKSKPPGLFVDEAMYGVDALKALHTGQYAWFYPANFGREGLFINIQAFFLHITQSREPWVLHIQGTIANMVTILGMYFLGKEVAFHLKIKRPIFYALICSLLIAVNLSQVILSRVGFSALLAPLFWVWSYMFLFRSLRTKSVISSLMAGLLFGVGLHSYLAFRLAPLCLIPLIPLLWIKGMWKIALTFIIGACITAAPLVLYFIAHPEYIAARTGAISVFSVSYGPLLILVNILAIPLMLLFFGDFNWRHNVSGQPALLFPLALFFLIAVVYCWNQRKRWTHTWLVWSFFVGFLPMIFSLTANGIPHTLRSILATPPMFLLVALGWVQVDQWVREKGLFKEVSVQKAHYVLALFLALSTSAAFFGTWIHQDALGPMSFDGNAINNAVTAYKKLPPHSKTYMVVPHWDGREESLPVGVQSFAFQTYTLLPEERQEHNLSIVSAFPPETENNAAIFTYNAQEWVVKYCGSSCEK
jgi:hypothetical protein